MRGPTRQRRRFPRVAVAPGALALELPSTGAEAAILDLSPDGVSIASQGETWRPTPGVSVALRTPLDRICCLADSVQQRAAGDGSAVLGVHLELGTSERHALLTAYHQARFPRLTWTQPGPASADGFTRQAVYTAADGQPLGQVSLTRAYRRAWVSHDLSIQADHPEARDCRRVLYHHFASWPRLLDGEQALLVGHYDPAESGDRDLFERFAALANPESECQRLHLDRFQVDPGQTGAPVSPPAGLEIGPILPAERQRVAGLIAASWPALAVHAFDLRVCGLGAGPTPGPAAMGERTVLVARWRGVVVGAAICELAPAASSSLNLARLFFLPGEAATAAPARALCQAVLQLFQQRGVDAPVLLTNPGVLPIHPIPGIQRTGTLGAIIWTARGLHRYESYVEEALTR